MSNAHKIIKNFTSDKFSPELKEKLWKWLVDSSEQAEKDEALMELWEDQNFKANASTERSYQNFRRKIAPQQRKATGKVYLAQMAAGGGCITGSPALYGGILPIYTIE